MKTQIVIFIIFAIFIGFGVFSIINQNRQINQLEVGSTLHITKGYSDEWPSKGKILAIDGLVGDRVFGIQISKIGEPVYSEASDGKKYEISKIGHLPISEETLKTWRFTVTGKEEVKEEELEGYKMWKEASSEGF